MIFRQTLIKKYRSCLLTKYHSSECDGAHIIPQWICYQLSLPDLVTNDHNGLLLSKNLHSTFDQFLWTFDIHAAEPANGNWFSIPIHVKPNKYQRMINQFHQQQVKVPQESLPYLWIHYRMFLLTNYSYSNRENPISLYTQLLGSNEYLALLEQPSLVTKPSSKIPLAIIQKRGHGSEYLVVYQGESLSKVCWQSEDSLPENLISDFENRRYLDIDADYQSY